MIKLVIMDFDGCFTDGGLRQVDLVNAKDTYGLKKLEKLGIKTAILSGKRTPSTNDLINKRVDDIYLNIEDKDSKFREILLKYNLTENEVAYIGDDEMDIGVLNRVKISGCPSDAIDEVKKICKFKSRYKGGNGSIREFIEYIIKYNQRYIKPIVAVIPVRSGSIRCVNKNIRDFGLGENLLEKRVKILSEIDEIDKIIVTSDSQEYLDLIKDYNKVVVDKRPDYYASSNISGSELYRYVISLIGDEETMLYTNVVSPFLDKGDFLDAIKKWKDNILNDSVNTVSSMKEFIWDDNGPLNYDYGNVPKSQDLPKYDIITYGINILDTKTIIENNNLIGLNPIFIELDKIKAIDVDDNFDFTIAKVLNENNINNEKGIISYLNKPEIEVMDCTIRDGGYRNNWNFTDDQVSDIYNTLSQTGVEYFEIGFRSPKIENKGKWYNVTSDMINVIRDRYKGDTPAKMMVMIKYGEYDLDDLDDSVDTYRIIVDRGLLTDEHNEFTYQVIKKINSLGKEVFVNIRDGHDFIISDVESLFKKISKLDINGVYLADTAGSMDELSIIKSFNDLNMMLDRNDMNVAIGLHLHNHKGDALQRIIYAIDKIHNLKYVDCCILGAGRGPGNLKLEEILPKLNDNYKKDYNYMEVYKLLYNDFDQVSDILYKLAAMYQLHPNYVDDMLNNNIGFDIALDLSIEINKLGGKDHNKILIQELINKM